MGEGLTTHIKKRLASGSSDTQVDLTLVWEFQEIGGGTLLAPQSCLIPQLSS